VSWQAPSREVRTALIVEEVAPPASFPDWVDGLHCEPTAWVLESTLDRPPLGRFSFAGADPYGVLRCFGERAEIQVRRPVHPDLCVGRQRVSADPFDLVRALLPVAPMESGDGLPPFCGGAVGVFGYELAGLLERLPEPPPDDLGLPDLTLLFVDQVLAFDHLDGRLFACGLGFDRDPAEARAGARRAVASARERARSLDAEAARRDLAGWRNVSSPPPRESLVELDALAERLPVRGFFDEALYAKTVETILDEILDGNVYQACLTQRLDVPFAGDPFALHSRLRALSPAPFAACLRLPDASLVSSSPERFLRVGLGGQLESRPIKGTRPRGSDAAEDAVLRRELSGSEKDRAENLMIVDLVRNDLGRVAETASVHVPEFQTLEAYSTVFQMVSTVRARLRGDQDALDAVRVCFPPGSMTGAPKIAAMRLLGRLERCRRGFYSGALGYLDVRGSLDLSVVIRSAVLRQGRAHVHVGGGVVADSDPIGEHAESMDKARALLAALATA